MAFLLRSRGLAKLVTCIVEREGKSWTVRWASEGKAPRDFSETSLAKAVETASSQVASLYAGKPESADAELQFAIYPWQGKAGKVILDLTREGAELNARDIQGTGISFHSESVDAVVTDAERYLPDPGEAMLRWIRPIVEL